jgi:hypothetical protein
VEGFDADLVIGADQLPRSGDAADSVGMGEAGDVFQAMTA